jgi:hypothetical protein
MKEKISEQALMQRINLQLAKKDEILTKSRGGLWHSDTGDYYITGFNKNSMIATNVDLEILGKELGVLQNHEKLEDLL